MLKRSPGPKVRGVPSSTIGLPEGSFLLDYVTGYSYPSRIMELKGGSVLYEKMEHLTGPVKNGDAFERMGIRTTMADRKDTVKCCDFRS